ncbi:uncharacterized protein Z518_05699 [Rhinocladiella mackenziei CBS 650.93]|uniref:FAD dependent oxidoreductase domain-containing protein n=1 Tax=Rhinocladiella mackenziei CBS 650.93 TaxID=1442369 RepID=A0A0D2H320_9EURO|nr:uncharacterized protein Z518_05699 [Rhinocladiella mackenziei CBS 650.93]KIX04828.1 hypothetical protein Z518_05699 [Rhinocladiella mackenziei CBS 650.93]
MKGTKDRLANGSADINSPPNGFYHREQTPLHTIIVGAGFAGISLAYVLGRPGHAVEVLEAATVIKEV